MRELEKASGEMEGRDLITVQEGRGDLGEKWPHASPVTGEKRTTAEGLGGWTATVWEHRCH